MRTRVHPCVRTLSPNLHAELILVHSPVLRESCLVSYPPITYMLKFSGFADLTSCLEGRPQGLATEALPQDKRRKLHQR